MSRARAVPAGTGICAALLGGALVLPAAADEAADEAEGVEVLVVTGHLDSLPGENVPSLTGFEKPPCCSSKCAPSWTMTCFAARRLS